MSLSLQEWLCHASQGSTPDLFLQFLEPKGAAEGSQDSLVELREVSSPPSLRPEILEAHLAKDGTGIALGGSFTVRASGASWRPVAQS